MYKRHNVWDEDKWNIHTRGSEYSGSSNSIGYTGNGKNPFEHYHKSETYSSNSSSPEKIKDSYRANENNDEAKKAEDEKKGIVDAVEHEEKHKKREDSSFLGESPKASDKISSHSETKEDSKPKKEITSIEDAIKEAIKEEKQIVHID